jgi:hypothetical protein
LEEEEEGETKEEIPKKIEKGFEKTSKILKSEKTKETEIKILK